MADNIGDVITRVSGALDFNQIIGVPAVAVTRASVAQSAAYREFIESCLDENGKPISISFLKTDTDQTGEKTYRQIDVPLLVILKHPVMEISEFTNEFTIELSDVYKSEIKAAGEGSVQAKVGWGVFSASMTAKFSGSRSTQRTTDTRSKQHIKMVMAQVDQPEGMKQVLDMLAADASHIQSSATLPAPAT